jgi:O-antigen ligase
LRWGIKNGPAPLRGPAVLTARQLQLSTLASLAVMLSLLSFLVSNYLTDRVTKNGLTIGLEPPTTPVRFLGFLATAAFVLASLVTRRSLEKRELAVIVFVCLSQLFSDRLEDLGGSFQWQFGAIALCILWHRVPLHPKLLSLTCWTFVVTNLAATVIRPGWAFFRMGLDEPVTGRLAACASHPNELGMYSALLALIVATNVRTPAWRILWLGLMVLLFLAQSKTSMLCYGVAYVCYLRNWRVSPLLMLSIPILSIGYGLLAVSGLLGAEFNLTGRTTLWAVLLQAVSQSPFLGLGMEGVKNATIYSSVGFQAENHAHDAALQVLVQGGLLGFVSYCAYIYFMTRTANRSYLGSAVLLFVLIHSFTESTLPWTTWAYIFVFAAPFTLSNMKTSVVAKKPAPPLPSSQPQTVTS